MRILIGFDPRRASSPTAQWAAVEGACLLGYERTSDVLTSQVTSRLRSFDRCWLSLYRVYGRRPELNAVADREASLSPNEAEGRPLFPHGRRRGGSRCHSSVGVSGSHHDAFTNSRYFNLGVPENIAVRAQNGSDARRVDHGLMQNPQASLAAFDGEFKFRRCVTSRSPGSFSGTSNRCSVPSKIFGKRRF